jgi:hypothetical protein
MTSALIGSHGVIGQSLLDHMKFDLLFNRDNVETLLDYKIDQLVIAAPSGARLAINKNGTQDHTDVQQIVFTISQCNIEQIVLFGSVDSVTAPDTPYGNNRQQLESGLTQHGNVTVYRLPTLIGPRIKKNMLFDLKHNQFLDQIDAGARLQWCILSDLAQLVQQARPGQIQNIVSEPIQNKEILQRFRPDVAVHSRPVSLSYNQQPWTYDRETIFQAMEDYLK